MSNTHWKQVFPLKVTVIVLFLKPKEVLMISISANRSSVLTPLMKVFTKTFSEGALIFFSNCVVKLATLSSYFLLLLVSEEVPDNLKS